VSEKNEFQKLDSKHCQPGRQNGRCDWPRPPAQEFGSKEAGLKEEDEEAVQTPARIRRRRGTYIAEERKKTSGHMEADAQLALAGAIT
jgi:hypothetical protein